MEFTILSTKLNLPAPRAEIVARPRLVELLTPAVMSLTSKKAPLEQGITMGLSNSFVSLGRIAGPSLAGFLFDVNGIGA
jgi:MFS family permease